MSASRNPIRPVLSAVWRRRLTTFAASTGAFAVLLGSLPAAGAAPVDLRRRTFASLSLTASIEMPAAPMASEKVLAMPKRLEKPRPKPAPAPADAPAPAAAPKKASRGGSKAGWQSGLVSWYGPGFYGKTMAGGGTLQRDSMVVAHRSLPFGTRVMFEYRGRTVTATVRDRGPYAGGRVFDLGPGTAKALGFSGVDTVRYRILGR